MLGMGGSGFLDGPGVRRAGFGVGPLVKRSRFGVENIHKISQNDSKYETKISKLKQNNQNINKNLINIFHRENKES